MRLTRRLWLLILPALVITASIAVSIVYNLEKKIILESEAANLKQHSIQLVSTFSAYNDLAESYLEPLLKSSSLRQVLSAKDDFILAYSIENNLTDMLDGLSILKAQEFSLSIIHENGSVKYYFEDSDDPFSEPAPAVLALVQEMFLNKRTQDRRVLTNPSDSNMTYGKIVDRLTLRPPVLTSWPDAVAVVMHFGMGSLDELIHEIEKSGYRVQLSDSEVMSPRSNEFGLSAREHLVDDYWLHIDYDPLLVKKSLNALLLNIVALAVVSVSVLAAALIGLIEFYITRPILKLESNVVAADQGLPLPEPSKAVDEVSSLERSFHKLYSQVKSSSEAFKAMAETDYLTHLSNRSQFNKTLIRILERIDDTKKLALLYIDLDNFKYVNDNYGHNMGDQVLIDFAERLKYQFRSTDIVFGLSNSISRLGGDEFCVLLYDFENDVVAQKAGERIVSMFDDGFTVGSSTFPISASVGVALYPRDGATAQELMVNADASMYQAKRAGKNQLAFYSQALAEENQRYIQVEMALKNVDYSEFSLVYMPQVSVTSGRIDGVEALIRWHSPALGFISPAEFIPIAEATGVFRKLDLWVMARVLQDRTTLHDALGNDIRISINISAAQLNSGRFFLDVMLLMQKMDQSPSGLVFEITETFAAHKSELLNSNLNLLRSAGFELALDDFGTGYSSMVQLVDYPIDEIKIDKYMIDNLERPQTRELVNAMTTFFHSTGYRVTVEGVETQAQQAILQSMTIDTYQGYLYSKPVPLNELAMLGGRLLLSA